MKRVLSLVLLLALFVVGCGKKETTDDGNKKIVVWTFNEDLKFMAEKYKEKYPNREVEVVIITAADYAVKANATLRGKSATPDIIVGEADWVKQFYEAGYFEDLTKEPYKADQYKDKIIDYVYEVGKDTNGVLRTLSYQVTPGGLYYRRDLAKKVWGNDSPEFVAKKFKNLETLSKTAEELNKKGIKIFPETGSIRYFSMGKTIIPWVKDGSVALSPERITFYDVAKKLYTNKEVAFMPEWSPGWFAGMNGTIVPKEGVNAEKVDIFAYQLPTWGMVFFLQSGKDMEGKWGVTSGPNPYVWGGTFVGISAFSKNKVSAWEFLKFATLDEENLTWWAESRGDVVSSIPVLNKLANKTNAYLGNQKIYEFWGTQAKKVDYSKVTKYDRQVDDYFQKSVTAYQEGKITKEEAIKEFYKNVKTVYPELKIPE